MVFLKVRRHVSVVNIGTVLLVLFAMSGGAFAAGKYLINSAGQINPKVLKKLRGKEGPGGPAGPSGPQGATGAQGLPGGEGKEGKAGTNGINGESVASSEVKTVEGACEKRGGSKFIVGGKETFACNGKEGTFGSKPLPKGQTLTGVYAGTGFGEAGVPEPGFGRVEAAVSFADRVANLELANVHYITESEWSSGTLPAGCTGTAQEPGATEGNLCVFGQAEINLFTTPFVNLGGPPTGSTGFIVADLSAAKGPMQIDGAWAVTAK